MASTTHAPPTDLPHVPARPADGHKGTFGTVLVVGGCARPDLRMIGAPALAARAALRAGCGLAKLLVPALIADACVTLCPSATAIPLPVDARGVLVPHEVAERLDAAMDGAAAIVVGPGLGPGLEAAAAALRALQQEDAPVIVDADAINALADVPELTRDVRAPAVFTPHPGEFRRLAASLRVTRDPIDPRQREHAAAELAQRLGAIVVLKGARTVVSDGQRTWTNDAGGPELATGGTGDVLAGFIAGLIASTHAAADRPSVFDLARLAVHAHGRAGALWRERRSASAGLLAHELADLLPEALEPSRRR